MMGIPKNLRKITKSRMGLENLRKLVKRSHSRAGIS
jgi:hypothetical protein